MPLAINDIGSSGKKIAVVDDDSVLIEVVCEHLSDAGYTNIITYHDASRFVEDINNKYSFSLILLDLNMPNIDGIEVIRHLSNMQYSGEMVIMSGESDQLLSSANDFAHQSQINIKGFLSKPFTKKNLINEIKKEHSNKRTCLPDDGEPPTKHALSQAILRHEIQPYIQPKYNIDRHSVDSGEILARWVTKDKILPPSSFIELAEEYQLIEMLTFSILEQALNFHVTLLKNNPDFRLSINVSNQCLANHLFPDEVTKLARSYHIPNHLVTLEITEESMLSNLKCALDVLIRLRINGFGVSIDDFGTGHSSLSRLSKLPFTELKIDKSFISALENSASARSIAEASLILAKKLSLDTVAEGIETLGQYNLIKNLGCDHIQGKLIAMPMAIGSFESWLSSFDYSNIPR